MTEEKTINAMWARAEKKKKRTKYFFIFAMVLVFLAFVIFMYLKFFNIRKINVYGLDGTDYTVQEMIEAAGVKQGDNLISLSSSNLDKSLRNKYPYIESVEVSKKFPTTLNISLKFHKAVMSIELGADVFLLSSGGKVLGVLGDGEEKEICKTLAPLVSECYLGEKLRFEQEDNFSVLINVYASFEKNGIASKLTQLDIRDKFNIKAKIENRFDIIFGSYENSDAKASLLSEVLAGDLWTDASGVIDVSDTREAVVRLTGTAAN